MDIREFGVEIWMNEFENDCAYNLAETCVDSLTIAQLIEMAGRSETVKTAQVWDDLAEMRLSYGAIEGSDGLRDAISGLYSRQARENIVVTHGTIGANALIYQALVSAQDHVIAVLPTYQQHYSIPESLGARVSTVMLREENGFLPDLEELKALATPGTRLIAITNPNNPTGALMDRAFLLDVVEIARGCGAYLLCDEVYRGTDQEGSGSTVSVVDLYEKGISTSGMSKAFSLAGLRLGWIAAPIEVMSAVSVHRDYNTISVGMIDDYFATMALVVKEQILARSREITRRNLGLLEAWIAGEPSMSFVTPKSATVALLKYAFDMPSQEFCRRLLKETGVLLTPGSTMEMEGYVRIGYANNSEVVAAGLKQLSGFLAQLRSEL